MSLLPILSFSLLLLSIHTYSSPDCKRFKCGDLTIDYPFSLYDTSTTNPDHCGLPGLLISCENHVPILHLQSANYTVQGIDYENRTIVLVDTDVLDQNETCPRVKNNVTFFANAGIDYTNSDVNLTFFYECNIALNNSPISCFTSNGHGDSYVFRTNDIPTNLYAEWSAACQLVVVVPVLEYYLDPLYNDLNTEFGQALRSGFQLGWNSITNCTKCLDNHGQCGYTLRNYLSYDFHCFCVNGTCDKKAPKHAGVIIGISLATFISLFAIFILCLLVYRKRDENVWFFGTEERKREQFVEATLENFEFLAPKRYKFSEIRKMTKSFNQKIGQGGFASVFKGELIDGSPVAIKVFKDRESSGVEFTSEVVSIARTSHVNIVKLLGFSIKGSKRALIYEFMSNGSLDKYLRASQNSTLSRAKCTRLFEIAVGVARGLEYLHRGCSTRIVHFDIKPHNILLDQDYCPKISDFGLAKFCQPKESAISMSGMRGTIGYIAPEVFSRNFGIVSSKSDVYSYGMMVLEMFGGKEHKTKSAASSSEIYFPDSIYNFIEQSSICSTCGVSDDCEELVRKVMIVGLWCIQLMPNARPTMSGVLDMLERSVEDLTMPPKLHISLMD
ncbi:Protein kinase family protein [Rhynchospora pubera]|uniref:Protein kinase family protein n=1 Tax=Rhynchospora pubera TaxID=906938 RepID=A0AAV8G0Q9_9POAL|nr:Protein kinase family protein [Rhynchospora pubera]